MPLSLQAVKDAFMDQNFRKLAAMFPIKRQDIADEAVGATQIAKSSVSDAKLEKPVIEGFISAAGSIEVGEGFTVERPATGTFKITLASELASSGICVATLSSNNGSIRTSMPSKKVFEVHMTSLGEVAQNASFNFYIKAS